MSRIAWRIGVDAPAYEAHDLSGKGAEVTGGRWNPKGAPLVYASGSIALACLETLVHLNAGGLPLNRYLVAVEIPDRLWDAAEVLATSDLPVGWDAAPAGRASIDHGGRWLRAARTAVLIVPSVIVPEEVNVLINPLHADARAITARKLRRWLYHPRMMR